MMDIGGDDHVVVDSGDEGDDDQNEDRIVTMIVILT